MRCGLAALTAALLWGCSGDRSSQPPSAQYVRPTTELQRTESCPDYYAAPVSVAHDSLLPWLGARTDFLGDAESTVTAALGPPRSRDSRRAPEWDAEHDSIVTLGYGGVAVRLGTSTEWGALLAVDLAADSCRLGKSLRVGRSTVADAARELGPFQADIRGDTMFVGYTATNSELNLRFVRDTLRHVSFAIIRADPD